MNLRRIIGIILLIIGITLIFTSMYIKGEIAEGRSRVAKGEQQVKQGKTLFKLVPETKPIGDIVTGSAERKIAEGKSEIAKHDRIANQLMFGGIALVVIGLVLICIRTRKK